MTRRFRSGLVVGPTLGLLALGVTACTGLPDHGPVVQADVASVGDAQAPTDIRVAPPAPNATPREIAKGFLDAMTASPIRIDVAREFLSSSAAGDWNPAAATITYGDKSQGMGDGSEVDVLLTDADLVDGSGAWRGSLPEREQQLQFRFTVEKGEYRISNPRDALIVPAPWFAQRYGQVSLYYFDGTGSVLVPEPVFVPRGEQLATTLIKSLLAGPADALSRVDRTYLPRGLSIGLSVPVSSTGVAAVDLVGTGGVTGATSGRLFAQLVWTLRQDPSVTAVRVSVGGAQLSAPGGGADYPVNQAEEFDPVGFRADTSLYGLEKGLLVRAEGADLRLLSGPFSQRRYGLRSVALDVLGRRAAGVTKDGRLLLADVDTASERSGEDRQVSTVLEGATDLLRPAWDVTGRMWLLDRRDSGASVRYLQGDRLRSVQVPGVSGKRVIDFLVSRDSTRFAAVVRGPDSDHVRVGRIQLDERGRVAAVSRTNAVTAGVGRLRIRDMAWTSPTTIAFVTPVQPRGVTEVRTVNVDGAPTSADAITTTMSSKVLGLAGTPASNLTQYAITSDGLVDLVTGVTLRVRSESRGLQYVG